MIQLQPGQKLIVVTDLDGTLLDHDTYCLDEALPVLQRLRDLAIPLVINTSKTRAEWLALETKLKLNAPFIVENGSALYLDGEEILFGVPRPEILKKLNSLRSRYDFVGYADVDVTTVMKWTGLDRGAAMQSRERFFSEPLLWKDSEEQAAAFSEEIRQVGLTTLWGGRFLHVLGQTDKAKPLSYLESPEKRIVALGDRPNDLAMLERADLGIVIATSEGSSLPGHHFLRSSLTGPRGWAEMMNPLLDQLFSQNSTPHG